MAIMIPQDWNTDPKRDRLVHWCGFSVQFKDYRAAVAAVDKRVRERQARADQENPGTFVRIDADGLDCLKHECDADSEDACQHGYRLGFKHGAKAERGTPPLYVIKPHQASTLKEHEDALRLLKELDRDAVIMPAGMEVEVIEHPHLLVTTEAPTEPGWYRCRLTRLPEDDRYDEWSVGRLLEPGTLRVDDHFFGPDLSDWEWAGRIEMPGESQLVRPSLAELKQRARADFERGVTEGMDELVAGFVKKTFDSPSMGDLLKSVWAFASESGIEFDRMEIQQVSTDAMPFGCILEIKGHAVTDDDVVRVREMFAGICPGHLRPLVGRWGHLIERAGDSVYVEPDGARGTTPVHPRKVDALSVKTAGGFGKPILSHEDAVAAYGEASELVAVIDAARERVERQGPPPVVKIGSPEGGGGSGSGIKFVKIAGVKHELADGSFVQAGEPKDKPGWWADHFADVEMGASILGMEKPLTEGQIQELTSKPYREISAWLEANVENEKARRFYAEALEKHACGECKGSGEYVGAAVVDPCKACDGIGWAK